MIFVYNNIIVYQIFGLDYTVAEFNDQLEVLHNFWELEQMLVPYSWGNVQYIQIKIL